MITPVQLIRKWKERQGVTLVEVIVASSVFVAVSIIGVTVFVNVMRIQRRIALENAIYEDARFMMERIAREIRYNTIDYEEYYREANGLLHGQNYGCYAQAFYNPGSPAAIGALCSYPTPGLAVEADPGCVVDKNTLDVNTGQNPYSGLGGYGASDANALCDEVYVGSDTNCTVGQPDVDATVEQLYLINPEGTQKTYVSRKLVNPGTGEHAVALLRISGEDTDTDGIVEKWRDTVDKYENYCDTGFNCPSATIDDLNDNLDGSDGADLYDGFVPFTPLRTNVTQLEFFIAPVEDPRKAFAETTVSELIQQQPHVVVAMTVEPAESELQGFAGTPPEVTLQTTITSRVYNEVESYLGKPVAGPPGCVPI